MKKWLCTDKPKCLYSTVTIKPYVGNWGFITNKLTVYCLKKHKYILKYTIMCEHYQNTCLCAPQSTCRSVKQIKNKV